MMSSRLSSGAFSFDDEELGDESRSKLLMLSELDDCGVSCPLLSTFQARSRSLDCEFLANFFLSARFADLDSAGPEESDTRCHRVKDIPRVATSPSDYHTAG